jgi:hypothetical protein
LERLKAPSEECNEQIEPRRIRNGLVLETFHPSRNLILIAVDMTLDCGGGGEVLESMSDSDSSLSKKKGKAHLEEKVDLEEK